MIRTVSGVVAAESVAQVLPHEHVLHRIAARVAPASSSAGAPSSIGIRNEDLQQYRISPEAFDGQNLVLEKEDEAFRELEVLAAHQVSISGVSEGVGKPLVVDVTLPVEGRDEFMAKRVQLAEKSNVHLVAVTTCEFEKMAATFPMGLPPDDQSERLAKALETELMFGFMTASDVGLSTSPSNASTVGAGAMYQQIHCASHVVGGKEDILAKGIALAQSRTHAPVYLSFSFASSSSSSSSIDDRSQRQQVIRTWLQVLLSHGAESNQIVVCHADQWCEDSDEGNHAFLRSLLQLGVRLLFSMVGLATVSDAVLINPCLSGIASTDSTSEPPRDSAIANCIARLVQQDGGSSFITQLLVSTNIHQRIQYQRYGGGGYTYLFTYFKQQLARQGVCERQFEQLVHDNPINLLTWYTPPDAPEIPKEYLKCSICRKDFEPVVGEYFTKFEFIYCGTKCLRRHSRQGFAKLLP